MIRPALVGATLALLASAAGAQTYHDLGGTIVPGVVPIAPNVGPWFTPTNPANVNCVSGCSGGGGGGGGGGNTAAVAIGSTSPGYGSVTAFLSATGAVTIPTLNADLGLPAHVTNWPSAQPVTGTFWQATQPVSVATMPTTPVTGTFWQATQPVSLASLPSLAAGSNVIGAVTQSGGPWSVSWSAQSVTANLGTLNGAATAANQSTANSSLASIVANTGAAAVETGGNLAAINGKLTTTVNGLKIDGSATTQPVSASSLPLPSGAATSAAQATANTSLATIAGLAGATSSGANVGIIQADKTSPLLAPSTTTPQVAVAAVTGKATYVTAWDILASNTTSFTIEYGTQATYPCDTGTTVMAGPYSLTAQAGVSKGSGLGPVLIAPAGKQVCIVTGSAVQAAGSIAYTQF